ncbi:MAG: hypothetical protein JWP11_1584, partial [Frankiales bacterium]|nr:hypothetical protein [Frankiales bacterium]
VVLSMAYSESLFVACAAAALHYALGHRWMFAALAGAAAGIAVAVTMRRIDRPEWPDAQDPDDLEAVIDRPV